MVEKWTAAKSKQLAFFAIRLCASCIILYNLQCVGVILLILQFFALVLLDERFFCCSQWYIHQNNKVSKDCRS